MLTNRYGTPMHPCSIESIYEVPLTLNISSKAADTHVINCKNENSFPPLAATASSNSNTNSNSGSSCDGGNSDNSSTSTDIRHERFEFSHFLCGMYELSDAEVQYREGSIALLRWNSSSSSSSSSCGSHGDTSSAFASEEVASIRTSGGGGGGGAGAKQQAVHVLCEKKLQGGVLDLKIKQRKSLVIDSSSTHFSRAATSINAYSSDGNSSSSNRSSDSSNLGGGGGGDVEKERPLESAYAADRLLVGAAMSTAKAVIYSIQNPARHNSNSNSNNFEFNEIASVELEEEGLFLSFDWHNIPLATNHSSHQTEEKINNKFSVSTQASSVITFQMRDNGSVEEISRYSNCHSLFGENLPAWTVFSNPLNPSILASGGDDSVWLWDLRIPDRETHAIRKKHDAGVTSGQFHPLIEHVFSTGSYDEHLRIWDMRNLAAPWLDIPTGGGVWRAKWALIPNNWASFYKSSMDVVGGSNESTASTTSATTTNRPDFRTFVTCAMMQGGCGVYEVDISEDGGDHQPATSSMTTKCTYTDAASTNHLSYGIDVLAVDSYIAAHHDAISSRNSKSSSADLSFTLASCSFYEDIIDIWKTDLLSK